MADGETKIEINDKNDANIRTDADIKKEEGIFKRLFNRITNSKFVSTEINGEKIEKMELRPDTSQYDGDWMSKMYELGGNTATDARKIENDRFVRYADYEQMCLHGDTKIPLVNGKSIKIKDWATKHKDEHFYVYSYDIKTNKVVVGLGFNPRVTRTNCEMIKLRYNNGNIDVVTPDHLFLLESGDYVEASKLTSGDKIRPLIRRISKKSRDSLEGYEMFLEEGKWNFTHRMVSSEFNGKMEDNDNVHHRDHNKRNNNPQNLDLISRGEHYNTHLNERALENNPTLFNLEKYNKEVEVDINFNSFETLIVESKETYGIVTEAFDISVKDYNNFAISSGAFVHNCYDALIGGMVDTYADEMTQKDDKGNVISIKAKDKKTEKLVKELFFEKLKINENANKMANEMCKYGNTFYEIVFDKKLTDIMRLKFISPYKLWRMENEGQLKGFKYSPLEINIGTTRESEVLKKLGPEMDNKLIEPFKVVDFRIEDNKYSPFGRSILDSSRTTWKQLKLIEDAAIIYRLARAPARRVWTVDVGQLSHDKALEYVKRVRDSLNKKTIIDPTTGRAVDAKKAISMVEDFWIPSRAGQASTSVTELGAGQRIGGDLDDLGWFREKIMFNLRIPKSWMNEDSLKTSGKALSQIDTNFAKAIEKVQTHFEAGLYKIAYIYLILKGISPDKIKSLRIKLTPPSMYKEQSKLEFLSMKFQTIQTIASSQLFPNVYILKEYMGLSDEEIIAITGLMQAQAAGADMLSILTGKPSPFMQGAGAMTAGMPAEQGIGGTPEQQMQAGLGAPPPQPGAEATTPQPGPGGEASATPPTGTEIQTTPKETAEMETKGAGLINPNMTASDYALMALMNFEGKNQKLKKGERMLTESLISNINESYRKNQSLIVEKQEELLKVMNQKAEDEDFYSNGFIGSVSSGELKGLNERRKEKKEDDMLIENKHNVHSEGFERALEGKEVGGNPISEEVIEYPNPDENFLNDLDKRELKQIFNKSNK
jgi:hypothetical protein